MQDFNNDRNMQQTDFNNNGVTAFATHPHAMGGQNGYTPTSQEWAQYPRSSYDTNNALHHPDQPHPYAGEIFSAYAASPPMAHAAEETYPAHETPSMFTPQGHRDPHDVENDTLNPYDATVEDAPVAKGAAEGPFADPQYVDKLFKASCPIIQQWFDF